MEAYRRYGVVPVMRGGSEAATEAGAGAETPESNGSGLYDEFLAETPQELHPYVTEAFKKWDAGVTPKLQEAAQLKERFGSLAEIEGLTDVPPDELAELVQFRQVLSDPEQLKQWLTQVNQAMGMAPGELSEEDWVSMGETNGWFEGGEEQTNGTDPQAIAQQVLEMLKPELEPVKQFMGSAEQEKRAEQAKAQITERMAALENQHGELDENQREAVLKLAYAYQEEDDPIGKAFESFLQITGQAEGSLVDRKLDQPNGALNGGQPSTSAPRTSWQDGEGTVNPKTLALQRMKQSA